MACSHSATCPLHPYLNHSLGAWRDHFCDSDAGWLDCARYKRSLSGESMPLALLPNGKMVAGLDPDADRPAAALREPTETATATATATAVLTDEEAGAVLETARTAKPSLWRRFSNLFRVTS